LLQLLFVELNLCRSCRRLCGRVACELLRHCKVEHEQELEKEALFHFSVHDEPLACLEQVASKTQGHVVQFALDEHVETLQDWFCRNLTRTENLLKCLDGLVLVPELAMHFES